MMLKTYDLTNEYDLTDQQWAKIEPIIEKKFGKSGRYNANDTRVFINACFWIVHMDVPWRSLPERYGKFTAVNRRFIRWCEKGIWEDILVAIIGEPCMEWLVVEQIPCMVRGFSENGEYGQPQSAMYTKVTMRWMRLVCRSSVLNEKVQRSIEANLNRNLK